MKWFILTSFLVLLGHGEGSVLRCSENGQDSPCPTEEEKALPPVDQDPAPLPQCRAGSEWESGCDYCQCSDDGTAECRRQPACEDPSPKSEEWPIGKECSAGSKWKSRCRECVCSEEGYAVCNQTACEREEDEFEKMSCAPTTVWKNDCNTCRCSPYGHGACTLIGCIHFPFPAFPIPELPTTTSKQSEEEPVSEPLPALKREANQTCVAKAMFIKDCNICWCNEFGTDFFCTRKVCVAELPDEPAVETPEELRIIKKDCRPFEVFELDCNMCRCNPDGKSFSCTRRACLNLEDKIEIEGVSEEKKIPLSRKVRATPQESPKACQAGQEFRLDCNQCLCDNEGLAFSCTRIDCVALNSQNNGGSTRTKREAPSELVKTEATCEPGSVFQSDCNACRCTEDGHAKCTNELCTPNHLDSNLRTADPDPGFRCNPGEQFKRDCNDCTCSADGRSTFCTLRLCDEALPQSISP